MRCQQPSGSKPKAELFPKASNVHVKVFRTDNLTRHLSTLPTFCEMSDMMKRRPLSKYDVMTCYMLSGVEI